MNILKVIGGAIVVVFLLASCGAIIGNSDESSTPAPKVQANDPAPSSDAVRAYELSLEAVRVLKSAQMESEAAGRASSVAEVCAHVPSLRAKADRVDEILAELRTLDLTAEQNVKLGVVERRFAPVHETLPMLEATC